MFPISHPISSSITYLLVVSYSISFLQTPLLKILANHVTASVFLALVKDGTPSSSTNFLNINILPHFQFLLSVAGFMRKSQFLIFLVIFLVALLNICRDHTRIQFFTQDD
uniref:Uncharacterized protein n=1 Tax=Opuntia streptacantha TaxID=393608 RepID=A0A7C8YLN3_OPUST